MVKKAKGETTHYVFEGTEPIFEKKITNGERRSYVYALGTYLARVDGVISKNNEEVYFYHNDHVGSIRAMTDRAGKVVYNADYLAFGKKFGVTAADDGFDEYHGFTGKEYDPDTGLYYYNARWYDQDLGRFVSEDPAADPNNPNLYSYCGNNPVIRIDPSGEAFDPVSLLVGSLFAWVAGGISTGAEAYNNDGDFWSGFSYGLSNMYTIGYNSNWSFDVEPPTLQYPNTYNITYQELLLNDTRSFQELYFKFWYELPDDFFKNTNLLLISLDMLVMGADEMGIPVEGWGMGSYTTKSHMNMVKTLQACLNLVLSTNIDVDGKYGKQTKIAVTIFAYRSEFDWPFELHRVTSRFGMRTPFTCDDGKLASPNHTGIDIGNWGKGGPIVAAAAGKIESIFYDTKNGWAVRINHGHGIVTRYAHLKEKPTGISVGDTVARGQKIGDMGATGRSTATHLHFGVTVYGEYIDPLLILPNENVVFKE